MRFFPTFGRPRFARQLPLRPDGRLFEGDPGRRFAGLYRLGESIEWTAHKYYVHKPADYDRWARICLGIIRHYNEGWANGYKFDIRYFEIWNEAEIGPPQWDGTAEDYYRLYATAARAIKAKWPELKVGGPAAAHSGGLAGNKLAPSPFLQGFLECCRKESVPVDFLSWHMYTGDATAPVRARAGCGPCWMGSA